MQEVRKAVITAAGRGTRQYPATNTLQKELIPLVDTDGFAKPTLQIILEDAMKSGIEEFCVVANPDNAQPIWNHFRGLTEEQRAGAFQGRDWAFPQSEMLDQIRRRLTIVVQREPEGYGHAVYQAAEWVGDEPFLLMVGDHICISATEDRCPRQIMDAYARHQSPISSVAQIPSDKVSRYGTCAGTPIEGSSPPSYTMTAMQEKPTAEEAARRLATPGVRDGHYLCFYGLHVFPPAVFECLRHLIDNNIRERGEIQMAAAQEMLFRQGAYIVTELLGEQHDMGTPDGLILTQLALALHSPYREAVLSQLAPYR
jgi:UTP--glucose-1-phosphate uridylyltransferase